MARAKGGLGKGLEALFVDNNTSDIPTTSLKLTEIEPNKEQPRKDFDDAALAELADSIREHGVLQPLLVRPMVNGRYQIVAGERRWRASRMVGLAEVPVVIREMTDTEAMELALIENLQRKDLNIIEEALGYKTLMETYGFTQEKVAQRVGKSRPVIANALRLLSLPPKVEKMVRDGQISAGHARALLSLDDPKVMEETAGRILSQGLSVREVERLSAPKKQRKPKGQTLSSELEPTQGDKQAWGDHYYQEMELALAAELGRKVKIQVSKDKGTLEIEFYSKSELGDLAARLAHPSRSW
ncbi:ParB/RepB/Spo0J family partition protein [Merdimmobilis hominis]|jgi:ParB family chromosome partitioning protein|uniref:Chromosome-partitioning protein Spo0J n=1 Tax=uncultured Anaerotruncus sp. TaxID=905011 RepID=A0A6N2UQI7_9FIRM|nr:ParB/RepB/Spo0J family partition protein [Merdimmobilis hominis]